MTNAVARHAAIKAIAADLDGLAPEHALTLDQPGSTSLAGWFLGPKAENESLLQELIHKFGGKSLIPG